MAVTPNYQPAARFPNLAKQSSDREFQLDEYVADTFSVDFFGLTLRDGTEINIIDSMEVIEIYEDIFNPSISGFCQIRDMSGGLEKFQLTGGEIIRFRLFKPGTTDVVLFRNDLVVHTISKGKFDANNSITYKLEFTTKSTIESQKRRITKSFGQERNISKVVKLFVEDMGLDSSLDLNIKDSGILTFNKTFVSPGYNPIQAINYLAKRACATGDYYLFFERAQNGFRNKGMKVFAGIKNLRDLSTSSSPNFTEEGIYRISYSPQYDYVVPAGAETYMKTEFVELQNNFNHITNMNKGLYKSKVSTVNIAKRSYKSSLFDYTQGQSDFYVNGLLAEKSVFGNYSGIQGLPGERLVIPAINDPVHMKADWVKNDMNGALLMSGIRINVGVPGSVNSIGSGDIVYLSLPSDFSHSLDLSTAEVPENNMYSGKYFVTACRHIITTTSYKKHLELARASVRESLKGEIGLVAGEDYRPTPEELYIDTAVKVGSDNPLTTFTPYQPTRDGEGPTNPAADSSQSTYTDAELDSVVVEDPPYTPDDRTEVIPEIDPEILANIPSNEEIQALVAESLAGINILGAGIENFSPINLGTLDIEQITRNAQNIVTYSPTTIRRAVAPREIQFTLADGIREDYNQLYGDFSNYTEQFVNFSGTIDERFTTTIGSIDNYINRVNSIGDAITNQENLYVDLKDYVGGAIGNLASVDIVTAEVEKLRNQIPTEMTPTQIQSILDNYVNENNIPNLGQIENFVNNATTIAIPDAGVLANSLITSLASTVQTAITAGVKDLGLNINVEKLASGVAETIKSDGVAAVEQATQQVFENSAAEVKKNNFNRFVNRGGDTS